MIKKAVAVNSDGKISMVFVGASDELIKDNVSTDDMVLFVDPPENRSDYWSYEDNSWVSTGLQPTINHVFNYSTKAWEDTRALEDVKSFKWDQIKLERNKVEFGGFEYKGNIYDSDQVSQGRIMGVVLAGVDQVWTLADNTTVELSASELQQLYTALQAHIASVHERGRIARQLISDAETKEDVEAIQL